MVGGAGYGAYNIVNGVTGGGGPSAKPTFQPTALSTTAPTADAAVKQATAFLQSWQAGPTRYADAGHDTDSPLTTEAALQAYHDGLGLTGVTFTAITAGAPTTAQVDQGGGVSTSAPTTPVTFQASAKVTGGTWTYQGTLDVLQSSNGQTAVRWDPSVLFPKLKSGQTLKAGAITGDAASVTVTDAKGVALTPANAPSLTAVLDSIRAHASGSGGNGGTGVEVVDGSGGPVAPATVFTQPKASTIRTTLDARLQKQAEAAARLQKLPTGVVVIRPSDGHILAIANTASNVNLAINAQLPPGSTMKIITAAALFDHTSLTPSSTLKCMKTQAAGGQVFPNEADVPEKPNATMTEDFARSCNTAFVYGGYHYLVQGGAPSSVLHDEATQVFGFGNWSIGGDVQTANPTVPASPNGSDNAADFMGQGGDLVSPLVMASVAATVQDGRFHQPILLPDQPQTPASGSLSASDDRNLKTMMHAVAYAPYGTGYPRLNDLSGVGAKTGTAEVTGGTDGWMTAYNGQIAVASVVQGGSSGVDTAGYVVRALLQATGS